MSRTPKLTLPERAALTRKIADEHRRLARRIAETADRLDRDAALMDRGVDPYASRGVA